VSNEPDDPMEAHGPDGQRFFIDGEEFGVITVPHPDPAVLEALTAAEWDVCELVLQGASNAEIARLRGVSVNTVTNQVATIFQKLGVNSRSELAARCA